MTWDRFWWALLFVFCGVMSVLVNLVTDVSPWVTALIIIGWALIFVHYWPEEDE